MPISYTEFDALQNSMTKNRQNRHLAILTIFVAIVAISSQ